MGMKCLNCGGTEFAPFTEGLKTRVGDVTVIDRSLAMGACAKCGEWEIPADVLEKAELRAALIALSDRKPMTGAVLRGARRILGMTQRELGPALNMRHETLCRHEKEAEPIADVYRVAMIGLIAERLQVLEMMGFDVRENADACGPGEHDSGSFEVHPRPAA